VGPPRGPNSSSGRSAPIRALTRVMPGGFLISGPDYLRWRRRDIAGGPLGPGGRPAKPPAA
jgi:hypothetical protein